jgi:hypothetical protein
MLDIGVAQAKGRLVVNNNPCHNKLKKPSPQPVENSGM